MVPHSSPLAARIVPPCEVNNIFSYRETNPVPPLPSCPCFIRFIKTFKNKWQVPFWNSVARIRYCDVTWYRHTVSTRTVTLPPIWCMPNRIINQVSEHLLQTIFICIRNHFSSSSDIRKSNSTFASRAACMNLLTIRLEKRNHCHITSL